MSYLTRPRLIKSFQDAVKHKVILVTAPAGYGKTTFLSEVLKKTESPVAWISLEKRDDHLFEFWNNIIMAIQKIYPIGIESQSVQQKSKKSIEHALTELINGVSEFVPNLVIVFDDFHYIESKTVHDSIEYFINYLPPQTHLIISSRVNPPLALSRLRGQGHVAEITAVDLKFTLKETYGFLNDVMNFALKQPMVQHIHNRIEGWIAGLQMIVIAMHGNPDINALLAAFRGSSKNIMEYLTSEVLDQQEQPIRRFLLETSILDCFNGEICDYIFERNDSRNILDTLVERNLFLQSVDNEDKWFSYHSLFRHSLNKKISMLHSDILPHLHKRASHWFEQKGMIENAIEHALEACEYERAVELFDKITVVIMGQDKCKKFWVWFNKLPEEFTSKSLWANIGCAVACEMTREVEHEKRYMKTALSLSKTTDISEYRNSPYYAQLLGSLYVMKTMYAYHNGDILQALKYSEEGLAALPKDEIKGRSAILCARGFALWMHGELYQSYRCCEEAANLCKEVEYTYSAILNLTGVAHARFAMGHLNSAVAACHEISRWSMLHGKEISSSCYSYLLLARILYQRNLLDEAEEQINRAISLSENGQEMVLWLNSQMALARINIVRGRVDVAIEIASQAKTAYQIALPNNRFADMLMSRLWLMVCDESTAADCIDTWTDLFFSQTAGFSKEKAMAIILEQGVYENDYRNVWPEIPLLNYVRVKLAQGKLEGLVELLESVHRDVEAKQWRSILLETIILESLVFNATGDFKAAVTLLRDALVLAEKENYLRVFTDEGEPMLQLLQQAKRRGITSKYISEILSVFKISADMQPNQMTDKLNSIYQPLTKRETQILQLICGGASNQEISQRLFISLSTVKNHIHCIYNKLDTDNRAQAVILAKELGLIKASG
ncbi:LuxR C-terminal-related transcriptional regulator [Dehalobacter sp. DCM]|uniref:LuxR C-terminal-related transcriptional regulator n=1 Tax=Dehalobacter sp. DCM TaxID=2907827 RepID=UPI003082147F|nr:LuxR C-terminal-related transcriptional regulator [Dehalobacter sp. DCM]